MNLALIVIDYHKVIIIINYFKKYEMMKSYNYLFCFLFFFKKIWRHSFNGTYLIYDINKNKLFNLTTTSNEQLTNAQFASTSTTTNVVTKINFHYPNLIIFF